MGGGGGRLRGRRQLRGGGGLGPCARVHSRRRRRLLPPHNRPCGPRGWEALGCPQGWPFPRSPLKPPSSGRPASPKSLGPSGILVRVQGAGRACKVGTLSPRARAGPGGCPIQRSGCLAPAVQTDRQTDASFHQLLPPGCLPEPSARAARAGRGVSGRQAVSGPAGIGRAPGPAGTSEVPPGETEAALAEPAWRAGTMAPACPSPECLPGGVPALCPPCPALCPQLRAPRPCPPRTSGSAPWPSPHVAADMAAPSALPSLRTQDGTLLVMLTSPWRGFCRFFPNLCLRQQKEGVSCGGCPGRVGAPGTVEEHEGGRHCSRRRPVWMAGAGMGSGGGGLSQLQLSASGFADTACSLREACPWHAAPALWPPEPASLICQLWVAPWGASRRKWPFCLGGRWAAGATVGRASSALSLICRPRPGWRV